MLASDGTDRFEADVPDTLTANAVPALRRCAERSLIDMK